MSDTLDNMYTKFHVWLIFSFKIIEKVYVILDRPSYKWNCKFGVLDKLNGKFDELDKLNCKFDELDELRDEFDELDKLKDEFDELD